jgi:hypothetical protein
VFDGFLGILNGFLAFFNLGIIKLPLSLKFIPGDVPLFSLASFRVLCPLSFGGGEGLLLGSLSLS